MFRQVYDKTNPVIIPFTAMYTLSNQIDSGVWKVEIKTLYVPVKLCMLCIALIERAQQNKVYAMTLHKI